MVFRIRQDTIRRSTELHSGQGLSQKYDRMATGYDLAVAAGGLLGLRRLRATLLKRASGQVLEVAVGTGLNLPQYTTGCSITAVDLSPSMVELARQRADRWRLDVKFFIMDAATLEFSNWHFDTVVSSLATCTFADPIAVLREMQRVCRPDGRVLLLEHGRSNHPWLERWQDRTADGWFRLSNCRWNQNPLELVEAAGMKLISVKRSLMGMFYLIEAEPYFD